MEASEKKVRSAQKLAGTDRDSFVVIKQKFAQKKHQEYKDYEAATAQSRAYKSQAQAQAQVQALQPEEAKGDASANVGADSTSKKTSRIDAAK